MVMKRICMNKVREIIRLKEQCNLGQRAIARALNISRPVVKEYLNKWIFDTKNHKDYLELIGKARLNDLRIEKDKS